MLGVFCAVTAGWASRGSAVSGLARADAAHVQVHNPSPAAPGFSAGSSPTPHKTTKTAWMTRDRPPTWARSSPPTIGSPLPTSFAAAVFRLPRAPSRSPGAVPSDRDLLTLLCVARC
ncbi:hypothetical protein GCM10023161_30190 [Mycobacterium paraffinicum]|uniref:Secreted protein n=1 Tax=Mycobacterium paraffinicum TaxID=53378 RepID=A0ABP8RPH1_9MYCO